MYCLPIAKKYRNSLDIPSLLLKPLSLNCSNWEKFIDNFNFNSFAIWVSCGFHLLEPGQTSISSQWSLKRLIYMGRALSTKLFWLFTCKVRSLLFSIYRVNIISTHHSKNNVGTHYLSWVRWISLNLEIKYARHASCIALYASPQTFS